jgi:hypothetical protein
MTRSGPPKTTEALLDAIDRLIDSAPPGEQEIAALLKSSGIDPEAEIRRALAQVEAAESRERRERFASADSQRQAALRALDRPRKHRSHRDNIERLAALKRRAPVDSPLHLNFKDYESASPDDLERIVAEFEHLLGVEDEE